MLKKIIWAYFIRLDFEMLFHLLTPAETIGMVIIIIIIPFYQPSLFHACNAYQECQLDGAT
jgi:hypothetical protein